MHGSRISSIISRLPCDEQQAVTKLAFITWQAISRTFTKPDPTPDAPLDFGYVENFARRRVVAGAHITTEMPGDPCNPRIIDFPKIDVSIIEAAKTPE
jgi:hypothetical protein